MISGKINFSTRGQSNVTGQVLLLGVAVALAAVVFLGVSGLTPEDPVGDAAVEITETEDGAIEVTAVTIDGDSVSIEPVGSEEVEYKTIYTSGDSVTFTPDELDDSDELVVISEEDNRQQLSRTEAIDTGIEDDGSGVVNPCEDGGVAISNVDELQDMRHDLNECYYLTQDIDASETSSWGSWTEYGGKEGEGFIPIGTASEPFEGEFYGNGHTIDGLYMERSYTLGDGDNQMLHYGMFGTVGFDGTVKDVTLEDAYVKEDISRDGDDNSFGEHTAILIGQNAGVVENVHVEGEVEGLVGVAGISSRQIGFIQESTVDIYAKGETGVGGISGADYGFVDDSAAHGTIELYSDHQNVGGSGGAVAVNENNSINRVYSTVELTGTDHYDEYGGLVGGNSDTVNDSYWDTEASGMSSSDGGTGLTTSEMTGSDAEANMTGFDFSDVWEITTEYPELQESS